MILESKGAQVTFFIMGIILICLGIGGLINFSDMHVNICLGKDSTFLYVLNNILIGITLAFMTVLGGLFIWLVVYSVKKCRKFEGEKIRQPFNLKKFCLSVLFYVVIFIVLSVSVLVVNYFNRDAVRQVNKSFETTKQEEYIHCTAKVRSYEKKGKEIKSIDWENVSGVSTLVIESPENLKGETLTVRIIGEKETDNVLRTVGLKCSIVISDKYLKEIGYNMGGSYNNSKGYITSNEITVMSNDQDVRNIQ